MKQLTESSMEKIGLNDLFSEKRKSVVAMAKEIAEREFEILELNFIISSQITKEEMEETDKLLLELRKDVKEGRINLEEADKHVKCLQ